MQEDRGQGRLDAHRVLPRPRLSPTRASAGSSAAAAERKQEVRPGPQWTPRERSIEAPGTDEGEIERLARRLEVVSYRMADLCAVRCWNRRCRGHFRSRLGSNVVLLVRTTSVIICSFLPMDGSRSCEGLDHGQFDGLEHRSSLVRLQGRVSLASSRSRNQLL